MKSTPRLCQATILGLFCLSFLVGCGGSQRPEVVIHSFDDTWSIVTYGGAGVIMEQDGYHGAIDIKRQVSTDLSVPFEDCGLMNQQEAYYHEQPWALLYAGTCSGILFGVVELQSQPDNDPQIFYDDSQDDSQTVCIDVESQNVALSTCYSGGNWDASSDFSIR